MNVANLILPAILMLLALKVWKRGGRERVIRVERMWILPLVFILIIGLSIASQPVPLSLSPATVIVFLVAFTAGFGIGWFRGRTTHIAVDAASGQLKAKMTPIGLVLIAVLLFVRMSLFDWLNGHAAEWQIGPTAIVDGFLLFALGLIFGWRLEMYLRCRRLLGTAANEISA